MEAAFPRQQGSGFEAATTVSEHVGEDHHAIGINAGRAPGRALCLRCCQNLASLEVIVLDSQNKRIVDFAGQALVLTSSLRPPPPILTQGRSQLSGALDASAHGC